MSGYAAACCCDAEPGPICDCDSSIAIGDGTPRDVVSVNFSMLYRWHRVLATQDCPSGGFVPPSGTPGSKRRGASGKSTFAESWLDVVYVEGAVPMGCRCLGSCQTKYFDFGVVAGDPSGTASVTATYFRDKSSARTQELRRGVFQTNNDCNVRVTDLRTKKETRNSRLEMNVEFGSQEDALGQSTGLSASSRLFLGGSQVNTLIRNAIGPKNFREDHYYRRTTVSVRPDFYTFGETIERNTIDGTDWGNSSSFENLIQPTSANQMRLETWYEVGPECDFFSQGTKIGTVFGTDTFNDPEGNYFPPYTDVSFTQGNDQNCFPIDGDFGTTCQGVPGMTLPGDETTITSLVDGSISGWSPEYSS